jgi:hypothetical protein
MPFVDTDRAQIARLPLSWEPRSLGFYHFLLTASGTLDKCRPYSISEVGTTIAFEHLCYLSHMPRYLKIKYPYYKKQLSE